MKFIKWLEAQGSSTRLASKLDLEANTVRAWKSGFAHPRPLIMRKLVKLSKGAFGYEDIIEDIFVLQKARSKKR